MTEASTFPPFLLIQLAKFVCWELSFIEMLSRASIFEGHLARSDQPTIAVRGCFEERLFVKSLKDDYRSSGCDEVL